MQIKITKRGSFGMRWKIRNQQRRERERYEKRERDMKERERERYERVRKLKREKKIEKWRERDRVKNSGRCRKFFLEIGNVKVQMRE